MMPRSPAFRLLRPSAALILALLIQGCATPQGGPAGAASADASAAQATSTAAYAGLLRAAKQNPAAADYTALRLTYARSPDYNPFLGIPDRANGLAPLVQAKDYRGVLARADALLDEYWLDAAVHFIAADAATRLGQTERATMHRVTGRGLLQSIRSSGDGASAATAYTVIATGEEYLLLTISNQRPTAQALVEVDGRRYDRLTAVDAGGMTRQTYFNVDLLFAAYPRLLNLTQGQRERGAP